MTIQARKQKHLFFKYFSWTHSIEIFVVLFFSSFHSNFQIMKTDLSDTKLYFIFLKRKSTPYIYSLSCYTCYTSKMYLGVVYAAFH